MPWPVLPQLTVVTWLAARKPVWASDGLQTHKRHWLNPG